jgi:ABC-2 type transport system ATP-binding protein
MADTLISDPEARNDQHRGRVSSRPDARAGSPSSSQRAAPAGAKQGPIYVERLEKLFRIGFSRKKVHAVKGISFEVAEGEIFGFLGPNGAGKTTTIKMLTGLITKTHGEATVFGHALGSLAAKQSIGFLPENPYIYPFLTPLEFVEMCGQLSGLKGKALRARSRQVLERTGVWYAADRPARRLSKGMLQRTGLAAALVADPRMLILDEPMSGLDPVGRKEVKDLIIDERAQGRTILFSTHILGDVETLCDRVTIMRRGEIVVRGKLDDLLRKDSQRAGLVFAGADDGLASYCRDNGFATDTTGGRLRVEVTGRSRVAELLSEALARGADVEQVVYFHETLEDLFVREAIEKQPQAATQSS